MVDMATSRENGPGIVAKIMVTDSLPSSRIRAMAKQRYRLYVPDDAEGWNCGINHRATMGKNAMTLRNLEARKETSDSSEDQWDMSSEDGTW